MLAAHTDDNMSSPDLLFRWHQCGQDGGGPLDSQDVLLWGEVKSEWVDEELRRIAELCDWGREFGLDGFVRYVLAAAHDGVLPDHKPQNGNELVRHP